MSYQHIKVPAGGQKITVNADFSLNVPDQPIVPYIEGDGTGADITPVMIKVVDAAVQKAAKAKPEVMSDDERRKLVSMQSSLSMPDEPRLPSSIAGLENFSLTRDEDEAAQPDVDAESFFNLPDSDDEDDSER